jgi:hypothetical protein
MGGTMNQTPKIGDGNGEELRKEEQIRAIKKRLADLHGRWPQHSVPPAMLQELEDLEDQLAELEDC